VIGCSRYPEEHLEEEDIERVVHSEQQKERYRSKLRLTRRRGQLY